MSLPHDHLHSLRERDGQLLAHLQDKTAQHTGFFSETTGLTYANETLARTVRGNYNAQEITELETLLRRHGTLAIPVADGYKVTVDGTKRPVSVVAATEIADSRPHHGDMSSMVYLRDHIQAASVLMELHLQDPAHYKSEGTTGRKLLISALHLMSTPAQLARFGNVILKGTQAKQEDWPHISLHFNDLQANGPNGWRNKQDSFQMLAYLALDAAERGFIKAEELTSAHKQFLGAVVPFLKSVGFPAYENSGSWEEVAARRTSVMAVETALLGKIKTLATCKGFGFLQEQFGRRSGDDFTQTIDAMVQSGLREIGRRLPHESPDYARGSIKYREADATLAYVLMYDLPRLLAKSQTPIGKDAKIMSGREIETLVLSELASLTRPKRGGMIRYEDDSYQRANFHTNEVQHVVNEIKHSVKAEAKRRGGEIDLDKKQTLRGELTPRGEEAVWPHPLGQLAGWAASRSLQERANSNLKEAAEYRALGIRFLNQALSTVTGAGQWHTTLDSDGHYEVRQVPAYKQPECMATYQPRTGPSFAVPSPHTPLNWGSATIKQAIGLLRIGVMRDEASH